MRRTIRGWLLAAVFAAETGHAGDSLSPACDPSVEQKTAEWRGRCDTAIDAERDDKLRAKLLFGRAYGAVDDYRYEDALRDLGTALALDPDNPRYLHERAYVSSELSNHVAAIADLDRQVALQPNNPEALTERAFARHYAGDLAGAYADRVRIVELEPASHDALAARAEAALWLGKFTEAAADAEAIIKNPGAKDNEDLLRQAQRLLDTAKLMSAPGDAARCTMRSMTTKDAKAQITNCTVAFFATTDPHAKTEALTNRAVGWQLVPDNAHATDDSAVAVGIEPGNADLLVNLGFLYLKSHHSWAAERMFSRALAIKRSGLALAGHAQALSNLRQPEAAFKEARESFDIDGNEAAMWVLGDLAFDNGAGDIAKQLYLSLYRRGSRDDRLLERLKALGVADPRRAIAEEDKSKQ